MFKLNRIKLKRGSRMLLDIPDLRIAEGAITSVIGANGAGKSTLFKVLLGEMLADQGDVLFDNQVLASYTLEQLSHQRAYIAQAQRPTFSTSVIDFLKLARHSRQESLSEARHWLSTIVAEHQIQALLEHNILTLSGGEFQRIAFARACLQLIEDSGFHQKMLLLDEPSSALDIKQTRLLYEQLKRFKLLGGTVLVIEHNINYAANFSEQMLIIKGGKVWANGHVDKVFNSTVLDECFETTGKVIATSTANQFNYHYLLTPQTNGA